MARLKFQTQLLIQSAVLMPLNFSGPQIFWGYNKLGLGIVVFKGLYFVCVCLLWVIFTIQILLTLIGPIQMPELDKHLKSKYQ